MPVLLPLGACLLSPISRMTAASTSSDRYHAEVPVADTYAFFTAHRDPKDFTMRWLHLEGLDRLTILRYVM